jgi:Common central domain of tyrosinase
MKQLARVLVCLLFTLVLAAQTPTRLSWQEFAKDPTRVQSFRKAVATMRARNTADKSSAEYRLSWEYWGNMHGYFGAQAKSGTVDQWRTKNKLTDPSFDPYFAGVDNTAPPDAIAQAVWDQCQHGTDWFFPWHRLYLYYFEQVLQDAAGDPSLRLPYWDYTDPANLAMPEEFTTPTYVNAAGETVPNPLFEARRAPGWEAPATNALDPVETDIDQALDIDHLLSITEPNGEVTVGYQRTIELSPHGYAHCAVMQCRATVMGAVPYSSNDPIFYIHHCNIDRLWQCWQSKGFKDPTGAWRDQPFSYVDRKGNQVNKKVSDLYPPYSVVDYVYDHPADCARTAAPVAAPKTLLARPMVIGETKNVALTAPVTRARVSLPATASLTHPRQFALRAQPQLPVATDLILRGVRFATHPGARIRVFLERPGTDTRALVGTMAFFSDEPAGEHAHHAGDTDDFTRRFDATRALRALGLEGTGTHDVHVVFEAVDEPIGPDFDAAAVQLTIDEIELQVRRDR